MKGFESTGQNATGEKPAWRCHHLTRRLIEQRIAQLKEQGIEEEEILNFIRQKSGDPKAPENLLQVSAEDIETDLFDWMMDIEAEKMAETVLPMAA